MTTAIKYSITALVGFALLASASVAYADDDTTRVRTNASVNARVDVTLTPEERREKMEERHEDAMETRAEKRDDLEERRDALKARGLENATDRIQHNLKRFVGLLEAGAERLEGIIARIESRAATLEEDGADTAEVYVHIDAAETAIADMYIKLGDIKGEVDAATTDTARETFKAVREALREAKDLLKTASQEVRAAVQALKDAAVEVSVDASTEAETDTE